MRHALVLCLAAAAAGSAAAQTVYRCGDTYSQQPCPDAKVVRTDGRTPTAREQAQARDNAQRDAALADTMEKDRRREEAKPVSAYIPPEKVEEAPVGGTASKNMSKPVRPAHFTAVAPGTAKKKKKKSAS